MYSKELIQELEEVIHKGLESVPLPIQKGNSIRIRNYIIRKSKNGYLVYCTTDNKQVARVFCKQVLLLSQKTLQQEKMLCRMY